MISFATCHEVCHGTAGRWCQSDLGSHLLYHAMTLPSIGGETHHYYGWQHRGHHAALGTVPAVFSSIESTTAAPAASTVAGEEKTAGVDMELGDTSSSDAVGARLRLPGVSSTLTGGENGSTGDDMEGAAVYRSGGVTEAQKEEVARSFVELEKLDLDAMDGDIPSPNGLILLFGHVVVKSLLARDAESHEVLYEHLTLPVTQDDAAGVARGDGSGDGGNASGRSLVEGERKENAASAVMPAHAVGQPVNARAGAGVAALSQSDRLNAAVKEAMVKWMKKSSLVRIIGVMGWHLSHYVATMVAELVAGIGLNPIV